MKHAQEWYRDESTDEYVHIVSISVQAPVKKCYDAWWNHEMFPRFMPHIHTVKRTAPNAWHWDATVAGQHIEWDAVSETIPNELISWHSTRGQANSGTVRFTREGDRCLISVHLAYDPPYGIIGDIIAERRLNDEIHQHLEEAVQNFKKAVESGEVEQWNQAA